MHIILFLIIFLVSSVNASEKISEELMEEASKAKVISKEDIIKEGDLIEIKREKLKPLDPIRAGYSEYTTPETGTLSGISQKRPYDSNWNKTTYSDYDFKLPTTSFAFGVKIPL